MEKGKEVAIKLDTLQRVFNYLQERPYKEVAGLIGEVVQNHRPLEGDEVEEEEEECLPAE